MYDALVNVESTDKNEIPAIRRKFYIWFNNQF
jgi:hypothetical protein